MGVLLVMQCLVTAGSVTKCDNLHCGLWKIFEWCDALEAQCQIFTFGKEVSCCLVLLSSNLAQTLILIKISNVYHFFVKFN